MYQSRSDHPAKRAGWLFALVILVLLAGGLGAGRAYANIYQSETLTGRLEITWGDAPRSAVTVFSLVTVQGELIPLNFEDGLPISMESLIDLRGELVQVNGAWFAEGTAAQSFEPVSIRPLDGSIETSEAVTGPKPWVSLLCKFSDYPTTEPRTPAYFQDMYRSTYPGLDHHWVEQSFGLANVLGSDATNTWYTLPQPRSYYVYNSDTDPELEFDFTRATNDCTGVANAEVYFPSFVGINMMFNADLNGYAWGGSRTLSLDGVTKSYSTTWEPPWGYADITVMSHEMGHGFGLPHSSGEYGATYDNRWDVMSDTWTDCNRLRDATFGCLGQHTISYHKDRLGWVGTKLVNVPMYTQATITLEQLALPQTDNALMAKVPVNNSSSLYYTVEVRRNNGTGYDVKLPGSAVIIHEINTGRSIPAYVKDIDGNGNTGDDGAQFLVGETFTDAPNNITISVDSPTATGFTVTICNACGVTPPPPTPIPSPTPPPPPLRVGDLDGQGLPSGSKWTARVTVLVEDANNVPVVGAVVGGTWSNGAKGSGSCTTDANGICTINKASLASRTTSVKFTITSVSKAGYTYNPGMNEDPEGDSSPHGTAIVILKP